MSFPARLLTQYQEAAFTRTHRAAFAALTATLFASAMFAAWGFTVDDALISTRVAHHLAGGHGYRFNPGAAISDAVTPLGWAPLLAAAATEGTWETLVNARLFGSLCGLATGFLLGWLAAGPAHIRRISVLAPAAICLPLGAWCVAGMETPLVMLLATAALCRPRFCLGFAALACAWRPELIPWALVLAVAREAKTPRERGLNALWVLGGPLLVVLIRLSVFGHPAPLAVFAKPSDFGHGLTYSFGALRLLGLPLLWCTRSGWQRLSTHHRATALACGAHVVAVILAGGDWMAFFRLFVPILPGVLLVAVHLNLKAPIPSLALRSALSMAVCGYLLYAKGTDARGVWQHRSDLITQASPQLSGMKRLGTLDVGWVGAATQEHVVDLAGVTDFDIAVLPGGHTSKSLPKNFLQIHQVDGLIVLLAPDFDPSTLDPSHPQGTDWREARFARQVEYRVSKLNGAEEFVPIATLKLPGTRQHYLVLRKLAQRFAHWSREHR